jgi:electron transfer flavoprotein beta subunit
MSISGIYSAKDKPLHVWNAADVAVDLNTVGLKASPTNVFRSFTPKPKEPGHMVAGDTDKDLAKNLLIELKGKHVI